MEDNTLVESSFSATINAPVAEVHNRQETPLFAKSIERHASRGKARLDN
jgi:hypothetical protein